MGPTTVSHRLTLEMHFPKQETGLSPQYRELTGGHVGYTRSQAVKAATHLPSGLRSNGRSRPKGDYACNL